VQWSHQTRCEFHCAKQYASDLCSQAASMLLVCGNTDGAHKNISNSDFNLIQLSWLMSLQPSSVSSQQSCYGNWRRNRKSCCLQDRNHGQSLEISFICLGSTSTNSIRNGLVNMVRLLPVFYCVLSYPFVNSLWTKQTRM